MTNIKGFFERKWPDTKGVCIKDQATDKKGEWYSGEDVWKFVTFKQGDPIVYGLDESGKKLVFIKTYQVDEPQTTLPKAVPQDELKHDDTVVWNKLIDIEEYVEGNSNMLAGLIVDMDAIKKHLNIKRETE